MGASKLTPLSRPPCGRSARGADGRRRGGQRRRPRTASPVRCLWFKYNSGTLDNFLVDTAPQRRPSVERSPASHLLGTAPPACAGDLAPRRDRPARCSLPACRMEARHIILFDIRARAPAASLANGAAAASSGLGLRTPAVAAATWRRPRVVLRWPRGPPQVPPARLPARHRRRTTWRQAHGLRALRSRRRRRRRERRQRSPRGSCDGVCACWSVSVKRQCTFFRRGRA